MHHLINESHDAPADHIIPVALFGASIAAGKIIMKEK
jgi:hypothetical protein